MMTRFLHSSILSIGLVVLSLSLGTLIRVMVPLETLVLSSNAPTTPCDCQQHVVGAVSSSSFLTPNNKTLASFQHTPGVILFFHPPKNGGTTVRRLFQKRLLKYSVQVYPRASFTKVLPQLKRAVLGESNNHTLFVEIHDGPNLNLYEMAPILTSLRQTAQQYNVPFFIFTLLRNPLPYMVSYYNYEHLGRGGPRFERARATEQDFQRISLPNPQCLFLARGEWSMGKDWAVLRRNFTQDECISLYPLVRQHFDWIGIVEDMQIVTLPLLSYMITGSKKIGATFAPQNVNTNAKNTNKQQKQPQIELEKLSEETVEYMRNITRGDLFLYNSIQRDYPVHMWTNL